MKSNLMKWAAIAMTTLGSSSKAAGADPNWLWCAQPAVKWVEALPLGNRRLGV